MEWFWRLYTLIEKTFWNSLTKKLCSFFFINLFQLAMVGYVYLVLEDVRTGLHASNLAPAVLQSMEGRIDQAIVCGYSCCGWCVWSSSAMVWYLRYLIVRLTQAHHRYLQ